MGDVFNEQIVKRRAKTGDGIKRVGAWVVVVALFFALTYLGWGPFAAVIAFAAGFGAMYLTSFLRIEYEYSFTNGELDIDVIYNRARRKRLFSASAKNFDIMASTQVREKEHEFANVQEVRDYSSGEPEADTYAFLTVINSRKTKIIIEPNEKMLRAIATAVPRRKLFLRPGTILK